MATTTNFGWETPDDTDLVKDGALAIRTLGSSIDTSMVDLKGGTTGQVLSKASNTDMDFTWVAQDDSNAIQNAIVDAKGDLISATAADTPARLAVGTNGQVLTADSTTATGLKWADSSSGGMTQISSTSMSGTASVTLSSIPSGYKDLYLVIRDFDPANDGRLYWEINSDTTAANYFYAVADWRISTSANVNGDDLNYLMHHTIDSVAASNFMAIRIPDYLNTDSWTTAFMWTQFLTDYNNEYALEWGTLVWRNTAAITQIKIAQSGAGNFDSGTVILYGVK